MTRALPALTLMLLSTAAFGQEVPSTEVVIPWGDWLNSVVTTALPTLATILTGVVTYVVGAYVPPWLRAITGQRGQERVNAVINNAVLSAIGQTKDAVAGKQLTFSVASEVLRKAMQYAIDQAPNLIKSASRNSAENLAKMIVARMAERGLLPPKFDEETVREIGQPVAPSKNTGSVIDKVKGAEFDFEQAVSKGMGGGG